ncbi:MAG: hypothetical protein ACFFER_16615 [Candidatus Thorarchaeota archaeon]
MARGTNPDSALSYYLTRDLWPHLGKSSPVQKGLLPSVTGDLPSMCEEGVGFGVPILQYKRDFYFPGTATVSEEGRIRSDNAWKRFSMNLIDRRQQQDSESINSFSWVFQRMYNRAYKSPQGRRILHLMERRLDRTARDSDPSVFFRVKSKGSILTTYRVNADTGVITVKLDFSGIDASGLRHIYVSNELGGSLFDVYTDSSGTKLQRNEIGGWDRIHATWAAFFSPAMNIGFRVDIPNATRAFRGREIIGRDICWSGVIFMLSPTCNELKYDVTVGQGTFRGD